VVVLVLIEAASTHSKASGSFCRTKRIKKADPNVRYIKKIESKQVKILCNALKIEKKGS